MGAGSVGIFGGSPIESHTQIQLMGDISTELIGEKRLGTLSSLKTRTLERFGPIITLEGELLPKVLVADGQPVPWGEF